MTMRNVVCWLTRPRLGAFQDGELGPAARAKTGAHLARCPACTAELASLGRLRTALTGALPEPPEGVWNAFWPQVRARIAATPAEAPAAAPRTLWPSLVGPRLAFASTLAAVALAVVAVLAPWQREEPNRPNGAPAPEAMAPGAGKVVVQSVETADPQSSVMVFNNPDSDMTVVWVFGLEDTDTEI
jgi:anti-sigma factor RsiW